MLNLPNKTLRNIALPKKAIYDKFVLNAAQRAVFDADISRMQIIAELSEATISISAGSEVASIFVVHVALKKREFNEKNIIMLTKLIEQRMVFVLEFDGEACLALYHSKLHTSQWQSLEQLSLDVSDINLDTVWQNITTQIGSFKVEQGNTLTEQIEHNEQRRKIQKQIESLERKARAEKQPKRKYELVQEIRNLKNGSYE